MTRRALLLAGALLGSASACQSQTPLASATLEEWTAEETTRLGAFDDPVLSFSRIADVAIGPDGNVYVAQSSDAEITVLSQAGELVDRIGRRGQGPGEFLSPSMIGWFADTLWVYDTGQRRLTRFVESGLLDVLSPPPVPVSRGSYVAAQFPLRGGRLALMVARDLGPEVPPDRRNFPILLVDGTGVVVDTLGRLAESFPLRVKIGTSSTSPLFHDFPLWRVARDGSAVVIVDRRFPESSTAVVRVTKIHAEGDTVWARDLLSEATPLTDLEWQGRIDQLFDAITPNGFTKEEYLQASRRPQYHSAVERLVIGDGGTILLGQRITEGVRRNWIELDPDGRPWRTFSLPGEFRPYHVSRTAVWGVSTGEFDVPYVVGFRLSSREG